jgi:hypothetical protein
MTDTLFIGDARGLMRVAVNGTAEAEWVIRDVPVASVAIDPLEPSHVYAASLGKGVWRSSDGGQTFESAGGIEPPLVWSIAVSRSDRSDGLGALYAGTQLSALFKSTDGGRSFAELRALQDIPSKPEWSFPPAPDTHHVHQIALHQEQPGVLLMGIELGGVFRSTDDGESWMEQRDADPDPHTLATHPGEPERMYEGGGASYCESQDGGASWTRSLEGIPDEIRYFYSLAVDSGDPDTVIISSARDPFSGHGVIPGMPVWSTLFRRLGTGPWKEIQTGVPQPDGTEMGTLAAGAPGIFYYLTIPGEIYRSEDGGESFAHVPYAGDSDHGQKTRAIAVAPRT